VRGVAQVQVFGSQKYAVRIQADPQKLASLKLGLDEIASAIRVSNVNLPTGTLYGPRKAFAIEADGQLENAAAYSKLIVAYRNGAPIRLENVGRALDSVENDKTAAWFATQAQNERAVILAVQKQPGANTVEVNQAIGALLPRFREQIPGSVSLDVLYDRSLTVKESVHDVELTLVLTLALVVMVIFVFLRRAVATIIPSLSMPFAILATFAVMYLLGYSLNNLSLMALTLSVGFVVDDAIVVLENIVRHVEMGKPPREAAYDATREIGFTIVSMTISLVAVFVPFLFMGGILGSLFEEFAVTIAVAILVSGFVSLTLTPMMSARLLKAGHESHSGWLYRVTERAFDASLGVYDRMLVWTLGKRRLTLLFSSLVLAATAAMLVLMPKGFLPTEDTDQLSVTTEAVQGVSFDAVSKGQQKVAEIARRHPDVAALMSTVGARNGPRRRERGASVHSPETTGRAYEERAADRVGARQEARGRARDALVHSGPPADSSRRQADEERIPAHAPGDGHRSALRPGAAPLARAFGVTDPRGRDDRRRAQQSRGAARDRSRPRGRARCLGGAHRGHALQRLRFARDLEYLHRHEQLLG
jgi:HAE1 family hydrophobic/amphiphilic exporter-1